MKKSDLSSRQFISCYLLPAVVFTALACYSLVTERSPWSAAVYLVPPVVNLLWRNRYFSLIFGVFATIFCFYMILVTLVVGAPAALIVLFFLATVASVLVTIPGLSLRPRPRNKTSL